MTTLLCSLSRPLLACLCLLLILPSRLCGQAIDFSKRDFHRADSVAALYPDHSLADLKSLSDKLTLPFSSDIDKFRAIYRWVCNNIENDYYLYTKNKAKREKLKDQPGALKEWNEKLNPLFFQKLLHEHKTVCSGYAYLLKELAFHSGLTCQIIDGYGRTSGANIGGVGMANHSWNAIELDKEWYLCDATWSSGVIDLSQKKFIKRFDDAYFLTPPTFFALNHYPLDTTWILVKDKLTLSEFVNGPLVYKSTIKYGILPITPKTFLIEVQKGKTTTFSFTKKSDVEISQVELQIIRGNTLTSTQEPIYIDAKGVQGVDYVFSRKGSYVVHLLFNKEYVLGYKVKVIN